MTDFTKEQLDSTNADNYDLSDTTQVVALLCARTESLSRVFAEVAGEAEGPEDLPALLLGFIIGAQIAAEVKMQQLQKEIDSLRASVDLVAGEILEKEA